MSERTSPPGASLSRLADAAVIALVVVAVAFAGSAFLDRSAARSAPARPVKAVSGFDSLPSRGQRLGNAAARVRIVEFSDFQCPYCARVQAALHTVRDKYRDNVVIVFRHFPLVKIHPFALAAAETSECAGAQGRFEAMHDALFASQDSIGVLSWDTFARRAAVRDLPRFARCVKLHELRAAVAADQELAINLGLDGTPTIMVEGRQLPGTPTVAELEKEIEDAMKRTKQGR